jgi:dihydroflavonol-4-reductase
MSEVFVTGGNGFVGSAVVRRLTEEGYGCRCLLRSASDTSRIQRLNWSRVDGDVREPASIDRGIAGCEAVVHLAGISDWKQINSPLMNEVTEDGTRNMLQSAREAGVKTFVFVSTTLAVNGSEKPEVFDESSAWTLPDRKLAYSRCKRAAERVCLEAAEENDMRVVIVNPAEVYGPGDTALVTAANLIDFAKSRPVLVCSGGTGVCHVDDVAQGIVRAMERGRSGQRYILSGDNLTVRELAATTLELLGLKKRIVTLPNVVIRTLATCSLRFGVPLPFEPRVIPYATRYWFVDNAKARRELDLSFRSAAETLASTLGWLKETGRLAC